MACRNEKPEEKHLNVNDELSKVNLSLYQSSIELWRVEEKCQRKFGIYRSLADSVQFC